MRSTPMVCCLFVGLWPWTAAAQPVEMTPPDIAASIHDSNKNGVGDLVTVAPEPFSGLIRQRVQDEDRAVQEFELFDHFNHLVHSATIRGRISVNNASDVGVRAFEFGIYPGHGESFPTALQLKFDPDRLMLVGTGQYHPPGDTFFEFEFDVTAEVQEVIDRNAMWVGLWVNSTTEPNFPNILSNDAGVAVLELDSEPWDCRVDINRDGVVDAEDFFAYLAYFAEGHPRADWIHSGVVSADDFFAFLQAFVDGC